MPPHVFFSWNQAEVYTVMKQRQIERHRFIHTFLPNALWVILENLCPCPDTYESGCMSVKARHGCKLLLQFRVNSHIHVTFSSWILTSDLPECFTVLFLCVLAWKDRPQCFQTRLWCPFWCVESGNHPGKTKNGLTANLPFSYFCARLNGERGKPARLSALCLLSVWTGNRTLSLPQVE